MGSSFDEVGLGAFRMAPQQQHRAKVGEGRNIMFIVVVLYPILYIDQNKPISLYNF